jgi:hypothetical protein
LARPSYRAAKIGGETASPVLGEAEMDGEIVLSVAQPARKATIANAAAIRRGFEIIALLKNT